MVPCVKFWSSFVTVAETLLNMICGYRKANFLLHLESVQTIGHGCLVATELIIQGKRDFTLVDTAQKKIHQYYPR